MREQKRRQHFWSRSLGVLALFLVAGIVPATAQYSSGIEGTVADQSGAVVPSAQVTVTNQDTQVKQTALSNSQGFAQILHLPPGRYRATVVAGGFATWEQKDIDVEGNDVRSIYPKLIVGSTQSTVEVTANSSAVETTSGTISRVLERQTVESAPLVGENLYASVATLAPGSLVSEDHSVGRAARDHRAQTASTPSRAFKSSVPVNVKRPMNIRSTEPA